MAKEKNPRLGKVGGQAVLEGVMMKSGDHMTLAVREESGKIRLKSSDYISLRKRNKFFNIPIIRGFVNFIEMMKLSFSTLSDSAAMLGIDDMEPETKFEKWLVGKFGDNLMKIITGISTVIGVVLAVGLFVILPNYSTTWINDAAGGGIHQILLSCISGSIKIALFIAYLLLVSLMKDIRRTFEYHGAEHKTVACYEAGLELTPENAAKCTRFHPRCGTSFLFVMMIISILVSAIIPWNMESKLLMTTFRLLLLPLIVGLGFEFLILAGKHPNGLTRVLSAPGLWMQRITTKEPDEKQLEIAIAALKGAMPDEFPPEAAPEAAESAGDETNAADASAATENEADAAGDETNAAEDTAALADSGDSDKDDD